MFYNRFIELCKENNITVTNALKEVGLSASKNTQWKSGSIPSSTNIAKLAEYFNVSTDYLLGNDDIKKRASPEQVERIQLAMAESPDIKERVEMYLSLSPEDQRKINDLIDLITRANGNK